MKPDETPTPPPDAPFEFGDRTLLALRAQPFAIEHEYGTMMLPAGPISRETTEIPLPVVESAPETDPIQRLEQKLDAALRLIQSLQQQLDSIDATLARALNR
ncbi:MAG TPA: hypothetical protein VFP80_08450 [Thermoanaerobaculia bacterium]|nr:hypothetical protein [Thermoanaerobaculia bacterium]